jgi:hypothetical protein
MYICCLLSLSDLCCFTANPAHAVCHLFVCLLACSSVLFVSACLSVCLSVCLYVCLHACLSVRLFICLFACIFVCLFVCLSVSFFFCCLFVCLFVCRTEGASLRKRNHMPLCYSGMWLQSNALSLEVCVSVCSCCLRLLEFCVSMCASSYPFLVCIFLCLHSLFFSTVSFSRPLRVQGPKGLHFATAAICLCAIQGCGC